MKGVHASKEIFGILQDSFRFFLYFSYPLGPQNKAHTHIESIYIYMLYICLLSGCPCGNKLNFFLSWVCARFWGIK